MGCEYYRELISCEADGELTVDERAALTAHLAECEACRRFAAALRAIHDGIAEEAAVPAHFAESVMAKISQKKRNIIPFRRWGSLAAAAVLVVVLGSTVFAPKGKEAAMAAPVAPAAGESAPTEAQTERNEMMMFAAPRAAADEAVEEEAKAVAEAAPAAECAEAETADEAAFDPVTDAALRYAEAKQPGHWAILGCEENVITLRHESGWELTLTIDENGEVSE